MACAFRKADIRLVERLAIARMLKANPDLYRFSPNFVKFLMTYYPDWATDLSDKKIIKLSKLIPAGDNIYFHEEIGSFLWHEWFADKNSVTIDNFVSYLFPIIEAVIFKSGQHLKSNMGYGELFQELVIVVIKSMPKFDPMRIVAINKEGQPVYTRVYSYFNNKLFWAIITITTAHRADNPDMDELDYTRGVNDGEIPLAELGMALASLALDTFNPDHQKLYQCLHDHLQTSVGMFKVSNHLEYTLREATGLSKPIISEFINELREQLTWTH